MGLGAHSQFRPCWRVSTDRPRHAVAAQGPEDVGGPPNSAPVLSGPRRSQGRSSGHGRSGVRPAFREPGGRGTRETRPTTRRSGSRAAPQLDVTRGMGSGLPARRPGGARRSGPAVPQGGQRNPEGQQARLPRHLCRHAQPLRLGPRGEERSKLAQEGVASPLVCRAPGSPVDRWRASVEWRDQAHTDCWRPAAEQAEHALFRCRP